MCEPTLILAGINAAATAYSIKEQSRQAKWQEELSEYNQNRQNEALLADYKNQSTQLNIQEAEEDDASTEEQIRVQQETRKRIAEARVSASESGVAGLSVNGLVNDIIRQGASNVGTIEHNFNSSAWQRERERQALWSRTRYGLSIHASYKPDRFSKNVGAALQIASSAANGYRQAGGTFGNSGTT